MLNSAHGTRRRRRTGFTLIELLVVISIIVVLVSLLLPALGKARKLANLAVSMANNKQVLTGSFQYRNDANGWPPMGLTYTRGMEPAPGASLEGWCTWQYAGKNCDADYWGGRSFDVEAADRPLNEYLYPNVTYNAPNPPLRMPSNNDWRTLELEIFRDPSDKVTYQRSTSFRRDPQPFPVSSYDDVGTSYHLNMKWWEPVENQVGDFVESYKAGMARIRAADSFSTSRFVWLNDQYADVVVNNIDEDFQLVNGYKDINKSVLGFLDGHAAYHEVFPAGNARNSRFEKSFTNSEYTFIFPDLPLPRF